MRYTSIFKFWSLVILPARKTTAAEAQSIYNNCSAASWLNLESFDQNTYHLLLVHNMGNCRVRFRHYGGFTFRAAARTKTSSLTTADWLTYRCRQSAVCNGPPKRTVPWKVYGCRLNYGVSNVGPNCFSHAPTRWPWQLLASFCNSSGVRNLYPGIHKLHSFPRQ